MIEKKLSRKTYLCIAFLSCVILIAFRAVFLLADGQIVDEANEPLSGALAGFIGLAVTGVCCTYAVTVFTLTRQAIKFKNTAFRVDAQGIHCTFVALHLFACIIAVPVNHIPWSAVTDAPAEDMISIRVRTNKTEACFLAKLLLRLNGYRFCQAFLAEKLSPEEIRLIADYCRSA